MDFNIVRDLFKSSIYMMIIEEVLAWNLEVHLSLHPMNMNVAGYF